MIGTVVDVALAAAATFVSMTAAPPSKNMTTMSALQEDTTAPALQEDTTTPTLQEDTTTPTFQEDTTTPPLQEDSDTTLPPLQEHTTTPSLRGYVATLPPPPRLATMSVDALETALAKLKVTGTTATQLLQAVREEEDKLYSAARQSRQTGAVLERTCLHLYETNPGYSDEVV